MALTTLSNLHSFLNIPSTNTAEDTRLSYLITLAGAAITEFLGRNLESATYTEYASGDGTRFLMLRQRPVSAVTSVCVDPVGYFGQATGAFDSSLNLTQGTDYAIQWDAPGPTSRRGILERINNVWPLASMTNPSGWGGWWGYGPYSATGTGRLAREPGKPSLGNVKIVYTAGYSAPLPLDIEAAANLYVAYLRRVAKFGGDAVQTESLGNYSYALMARPGLGMPPEVASIRQLLGRYREICI